MSDTHPIEGLMKTAMESIKSMVDVNTVVGEAVEAKDGTVIIPVSKVTCGFGAGGGEFAPEEGCSSSGGDSSEKKDLPFGGGSGGGVAVKPVGFLVVSPGDVRFLAVEGNAVAERIVDKVPYVIDKLQGMVDKKSNAKENNKEANKENSEFAGS